ncbi:MAG: FxsA cytoplasmic rane protein [Hyphomicrobiales bacterium]|nr:FxsA cytoplasmic rane protein [Hyphomicrobiales bacterium]
MRQSHKVLLLVAGWLGAELVMLSFVVSVVGWSGAAALGILTSLAGFIMIRDVGRRAIDSLQAGFRGGPVGSGPVLDGSLQGIGAILLILPGFVTDLIGLALASPTIRHGLTCRFGDIHGQGLNGTLDLSRDEWRSTESESSGARIERYKSGP